MTVLDLNAKACMSHLLLKPTFHQYSFIEWEVTTFNKFHIDGRIHKDFFDEKPDREYSSWKEVQEYFLTVIRGKRTPLDFKLILSLSPACFADFVSSCSLSFRPEEIQGLYLNFRYEAEQLKCITGTSMHTFTMDKTLEHEWDRHAGELLKGISILS